MFILSQKSEDAIFLYKKGQELEMLLNVTFDMIFYSILLSVITLIKCFRGQELKVPKKCHRRGQKRTVAKERFMISCFILPHLTYLQYVIPLWLANNCWEVNTWSISSWSLGFPLPFYSLEEPALPYFSNQKLRKQASSEEEKIQSYLTFMAKQVYY